MSTALQLKIIALLALLASLLGGILYEQKKQTAALLELHRRKSAIEKAPPPQPFTIDPKALGSYKQ